LDSLPEPPAFDAYESPFPPHFSQPILPSPIVDSPKPLEIFNLFFGEDILAPIVENTNQYAEIKRKGEEENLVENKGDGRKVTTRPWSPVSLPEIRIFIGLQIWMGVNCLPAIEDHWQTGTCDPIMRYMSCNRYQQIKRYFHISPPEDTYKREDWWRKMEPLASHLRQRFQQHFLPSSNISFDEMMVLCKGRSAHTIKLPGKPIDQGYKIYALCDQGYTYLFLFYSGMTGNEVSEFTQTTSSYTHISKERSLALYNYNNRKLTKSEILKLSTGFSPTAQAVCHLVFSLPFQSYQFNIYMDNYFTSIPLFRHLRDHGLGAAGTTRANRPDFPSTLTISKDITKRILEWNYLSGVVVNGVCAVLWQDNNTVLFLTTIHNLRQLVLSNRRKPKKTSTNASAARKPFATHEHKKLLPIPALVDDYNQYMGGVDIADQLRSNYPCHQTSRRNWLPLWFWALDTAITNTYLIARSLSPKCEHKAFRRELALGLGESGWSQLHPLLHPPQPESKSYVTLKTSLPPFHLRTTGDHQPYSRSNQRQLCWYCRYKKLHGDPKNPPPACQRKEHLEAIEVSKTATWCSRCELPLCLKNRCFLDFHTVHSRS